MQPSKAQQAVRGERAHLERLGQVERLTIFRLRLRDVRPLDLKV